MKKVLVVTYYWPPSGGGGVQRWLKFVKYLPLFGWQPVVYTPEQQNAPAIDASLSRDIAPGLIVIRQPIWEPYSWYRRLTGRSKNENLGAGFASSKKSSPYLEAISNWVRSNFFIPDARMFWVRPSVRYLKKVIENHKIDVVVTTGPPHSLHLIGLGLKEQTGVKWLADFRDPWTDIDFYDQLKLTTWANKKHHRLERKVLAMADLVVSVSKSNAEKLTSKGKTNLCVITNGYDEDDIKEISGKPDTKFSIAHIGTFMANRNPRILWEVLAGLIAKNETFKNDVQLHLVGHTDALILDDINRWGLSGILRLSNSVDHVSAVQLQKIHNSC